MRLLSTSDYKLHYFPQNPPPYAILSHTWDEEEVQFNDIHESRREKMKAWPKIVNSCRLAAEDGWKFLWIDTCCIDKSSSAELSESINSMFKYYEDSDICYAYLEGLDTVSQNVHDAKRQFVKSRWFTRGWTLQELLAPPSLLFVDKSWHRWLFRHDLINEIAEATNIRPNHIEDFKFCCAGVKLSWAKNRYTMRREDQAYSLLGILGINMPLLYGEGDRAFTRLQLEFIKNSDDETILAWDMTEIAVRLDRSSILAPSPRCFSGNVERQVFDSHRRGFTMTNAGLSIIAEIWKSTIPGTFLLQLNCAKAKQPLVMILTQREPSSDRYVRGSVVPMVRWNTFKNIGRREILLVPENAVSVAPAVHLDLRVDCAINIRVRMLHIMNIYKHQRASGRNYVRNFRREDHQVVEGIADFSLVADSKAVDIATIEAEIRSAETQKWVKFAVMVFPTNKTPRLRTCKWTGVTDLFGESIKLYDTEKFETFSNDAFALNGTNVKVTANVYPRPKPEAFHDSRSKVSRAFSIQLRSIEGLGEETGTSLVSLNTSLAEKEPSIPNTS